MHVLRRFREALVPDGLMLDLQVIRPHPVVEVDGRIVCVADGGPLFAGADAATAGVDLLLEEGLLAEEAVDDHDVLEHYATGRELVDDWAPKKRASARGEHPSPADDRSHVRGARALPLAPVAEHRGFAPRARRWRLGVAVRHPLFARCFARAAPRMEALGVAEHRDELLAGIAGRVVEIGAGTGANFAHYPAGVTRGRRRRTRAVPARHRGRGRRRRARARAGRRRDGGGAASRRRLVRRGGGLARALLRRRPRAGAGRAAARAAGRRRAALLRARPRRGTWHGARAARADVVWPHVGGGCHVGRDTARAIADAGFAIERCRRFAFRPSLLAAPASPHVIGIARAPSPEG